MIKSYLLNRAIIGVILAITFSVANGQQPYEPVKVIPPSPTAASLGNYGNYTIGYYTGSPDINIPLYEIATPNHKVPIRLSYSSSGIRVSENAGWAGLGWSLLAGGAIVRTVVGLDDFGNYGYYTAEAIPLTTSLPDPMVKNYFDEMLLGRKDTDPDIISYNFAGYSGKFVIGKLADGSKVFMDEQNNMKVEFLRNQSQWVITDGQGYKYYFGFQESSRDYTYSSAVLELPDNAPLSAFQPSFNPNTINAWYIDSIVAPTTEKVTFTYAVSSHSLSVTNKSEQQYNSLSIHPGCSAESTTLLGTYKSFGASKQEITDVYLKKIQFNLGSIEFNTTDRGDLEYLNTAKPQKLSEVVVKNLDGNQVRRFRLVHGYFNSNSSDPLNWRLKLDSVIEYGSDNAVKPPYWFTYASPNGLPTKYSRSIDHWGFFNNKDNSTILPTAKGTSPGTGETKVFRGGNRRPDSVVATINPGIISSINYPTGGSTVFDFELNEYRNLFGEDKYDVVFKSPSAFASPYDQTQLIKTFSVNDTTLADFRYGYSKSAEGPDLMEGVQVIYGYLYKTGVASPLLSFHNWDHTAGTPVGTNNPQTLTVTLLPGTYRLEVRYIQSYTTEVFGAFDDKTPASTRKGGGLRIKTITNYENGKKAGVRKFQYTSDGQTTGMLISQPVYDFFTVIQQSHLNGQCGPSTGYYVGRLSHSVRPPALSSKGNIIGYDKVIEIIGENGEGGRNEYIFINQEDDARVKESPETPGQCNPLNGKLVVAATYDVNNNLLKKIDYNYSTRKTESLKGVKSFMPMPAGPATLIYYIKYYTIYSYWSTLNEEIETLYNSGRSIVINKKYHYDNETHKELTRQEIANSAGQIQITKYKRAGDYPQAGASSFVSQMKSRNMVSPVIEEQTLLNSAGTKKLTGGIFTEYKLYNNTIYKPGLVSRLLVADLLADTAESNINAAGQITLHAGYQPEFYYDAYTSGGNVLQMHQANDENISYVWDHQSTYPIVEVIGGAQSDIAFSSFEADSKGGFTFSGLPSVNSTALTGSKVYVFNGSNAITKTGLTSGKEYIVSYWTKSATAFSIVGTQAGYPITGRTLNSWKYFEHKVTGVTQVSINAANGSLVDELAVYPFNAQMTTYSYVPLIGQTSKRDVRNNFTYYEFDSFGRLLRNRNAEKNILQQFAYQYQVYAHNNPVWVATGETQCKPCAANNAYITNIQQIREKDVNTNSNAGFRWTDVGTSSNCVVSADWQPIGAPQCLLDGSGYRTGVNRIVKKDMNPCSPNYNQTINVDETNTSACPPNAPNWQNTGVTRCKPCPANTAYITNILQQQQKDMNMNSASYNLVQWIDGGISGSCVITADWQNTGTAIRCKKNGANQNTGQQEQEQKDMNPCSTTFNQIQWVVTGTNTTACPLPVVYPVLVLENVYSDPGLSTADVVIYFYSDAAHTIPVSVSNLSVNIKIKSITNGWQVYEDYTVAVCNGTKQVWRAGTTIYSHDYWNDPSTEERTEFSLMPGSGYTIP